MNLNELTVRVADRFWLTTLIANEAKDVISRRTVEDIDIMTFTENVCSQDDLDFSPNKLGQIYLFSKKLAQRSTDSLIICIPPTAVGVTRAALLLGGHLIVCEHMTPELVAAAFCSVRSRMLRFFFSGHASSSDALTVDDCWAALHRAASHGWLDFGDAPADGAIDMEEHLHRDAAANGGLHVVVPDRLLALPYPSRLPGGRAWLDEGGARRFAAAYYAA